MTGCRHANVTFPQGPKANLHVTCNSCGKEFPYSWEEMRIQSPPSWWSKIKRILKLEVVNG